MQRPEKDLEEVYEAIAPPCCSHESNYGVVRRIDFLRYANPQCIASLHDVMDYGMKLVNYARMKT
jgi:hypothetical protein